MKLRGHKACPARCDEGAYFLVAKYGCPGCFGCLPGGPDEDCMGCCHCQKAAIDNAKYNERVNEWLDEDMKNSFKLVIDAEDDEARIIELLARGDSE